MEHEGVQACGAREPEPRTGTSPCVLPAGHDGSTHQDKWTNQWPMLPKTATAATEPDPTAAVEVLARLLCAADFHVYGGVTPTWQQLSSSDRRAAQDKYRKAAAWLLPRITVGPDSGRAAALNEAAEGRGEASRG